MKSLKIISFIIFCILPFTYNYSQDLIQTLDYINTRIDINNENSYSLFVAKDGIIQINNNYDLGYLKGSEVFSMSPFDVDASPAKDYGNQIYIHCINDKIGCINVYSKTKAKADYSRNSVWITLFTSTLDQRQYVLNAFIHLLEIAKDLYSQDQLLKSKIDPFANPKFETSGVQMTKVGNLFEVPVEINGVLRIKFLLDTGASDLFLSPDVFLTLVRSETISQDDYIGSSYYSFANGKKEECKKYTLKSIKIGHKVIFNVVCAIANTLDVDMLLGQSVLSKLGSYHIDNSTNMLIID